MDSSDSSSTVRATVVQDALVTTSLGTADAVRCSEEVKSDKKGKGVVMSSTFGGAIDIDSDDDSCYGKDYLNLFSDESESEDDYAVLQSRFDNIDLPTGVEAAIPHFADSIMMKNKIKVNGSKTSAGSGLRVQRSAMKVHAEPANGLKISAGSGLRVQRGARKVHAEPANVLRKYRNFKKFDIVEDYSDHHYSGLTENVSSILSGALPPKLQDPGNPIISIQVGEFKMIRALLDSGAGMSILPGSLYDQYEFGPLQATKSIVELADLTRKRPRGIVTDVIVKVEDFYYPVDFLVLDYVYLDRTKQPTVILGRPFLATSNVQINCKSGMVDMTFGNRRLRLNVFSGLTNPLVNDVCCMADSVDECISLCDTGVDEKNTIGECFMFDRLQTETNRSIDEEEKKLEIMAVREGRSPWTHQVGSLPDKIDTKLKPSLVEPPTVELKVLPKHLKYAYVGEGNTLPGIIASK